MITEEAIIDLLPQFTLCKNYADRLTFWQRHDLIEELCYEIPSGVDCYYPAECPDGQYSTLLPVLTIAPFTKDEAQQFVDWSLYIRPSMSSAPGNAKKLCQNFEHHYKRIERKADREAFHRECQEKATLLIEDRSYSSSANRIMHLQELNIDESLYTQFLAQLRRAHKPDLISLIGIGRLEPNWQIIDTYLYTKAQFDYAVFLESFNPDNYKLEPVSSVIESIGLQRESSQIVNSLEPKHFVDLFVPGSNPEEFINVLRLIDKPVISKGGRWIGGKGSKSILVAWIKRLEDCDKIKFIANRKLLVPLLNEQFPDLRLGRDARIFDEENSIRDRYSEDFAALI